MLLMPLFVQAATIIPETPGDATSFTPAPPSPNLGVVVNFSNLSSDINSNCLDNGVCTTLLSYTSQGVTVSSSDGLLVSPGNSQISTSDVSLLDEGASGDYDGTADINISLAYGTFALGVGISDGDSPVNVVIEALGQNGADLGSLNVSQYVEDADSADNYANTYFVAEDTTADIYGLVITQSCPTDPDSSNCPGAVPGTYSGLALDVVETTPEPSSILLLIGGVAMIGVSRIRRLSESAESRR